MYIDVDIGDEPMVAYPATPEQIQWENHYESDTSLASSMLYMGNHSGEPPQSSGWPSMINIRSTVSLLSSYSPQSSTLSFIGRLSPIHDVDELIAKELFASRKKKPMSRLGGGGGGGPMDVDFNDTDDSWLNRPPRHMDVEMKEPSGPPVLSDNAPFTFAMPIIAPEPAAKTPHTTKTHNGKPISPNAVRRIHARRQRQRRVRESSKDDMWTTDNDSDSEASRHEQAPPRENAPKAHIRLQMHRDLPLVISGYLQLGFNIIMALVVLYIVAQVLLTIHRDVNAKVQEYSAEILQEIAACSKQYLSNHCDPQLRVPAMEQLCSVWESCMHRDPTKVGRLRVSAETLAEIVNGFIEPISFKTMCFFVLCFVGTLVVSNFAFGAYRSNRIRSMGDLGAWRSDPARADEDEDED
ncbi:hypothetical protein GGI25_004688 [Coemansia spiralis]|uniref:Brl1/Brr6 domain-containing protein n=1 Tax=Coemansia spiralis TaxID=417178 RepID=A0A9W8KWT8_9FUNG|nr:hypothetical protein GGI25_004688 [Coemansia spiralis]